MTDVPRDRWQRPLVTDPNNPDLDNLIPYTRASTLGGTLEDQYNITLWKQRLTALGIARSRSLQMELAAAGDNKRAVNAVIERAFLAAGGEDKANIGTSLHALCEQVDRGITPEFVPEDFQADIAAYKRTTFPVQWRAIEEFVVCDFLQVGGTPDRIGTLHEPLTFRNGVTLPVGWTGVFDIKTGSVDYPHSFAIQLAAYAAGKRYNPATGERTEYEPRMDEHNAVIIHLPAGAGTCALEWLDISAGMAAADLAGAVRRWRSRKNLTSHLEA